MTFIYYLIIIKWSECNVYIMIWWWYWKYQGGLWTRETNHDFTQITFLKKRKEKHCLYICAKYSPFICLMLCLGHTHAGQLFPLTLLAFLVNPYFCGLYRVSEHTTIYVTPGTVYYGIPMRIGSRAEITQIALKSAWVRTHLIVC